MINPPLFYTTDFATIRDNLISRFEVIAGRPLYPAQPETLLLEAFAYELKLHREQMQYASTQMLIAFAVGPALDLLAELIGVTRLAATSASTTLEFTLTSNSGGVTIPAGTRVATEDGEIIFETDAELFVSPSVLTGQVSATASALGAAGNAYPAGQVNQILDPQPFVASVSNTTATAGGADQETDDELRERTRLAPAQFSVAGPTQAYEFFARQASPTIIDVAVTSPEPGVVNVYPLVADGETPPETLNAVESALNDEFIRPLTDTVNVLSPEILTTPVEIELTLFSGTDSASARSAALDRVARYLKGREETLGLDVKVSQLIAEAGRDTAEVFDTIVVSPNVDVVATASQVVKASALIVTVTGFSNG